MKKTLDSIDFAKFLGIFFVFTMHCDALSDYRSIRIIPELLARWGVPFFFICSSYFLFSKSVDGNIEKKSLYKYMRRIGSLYVLWLVFNLPNTIYLRLYSKDLSSISTWLIFLKNSILSSTFTGSWYLASSIFSAWFVYTLSKKFHTKAVLGISFVFYLLCVLTSAYKGILSETVSKTLVFLCFPLNIFNGCFYFAIGKYITENQERILKIINRKRALISFVGFYLLFVVEIIFTKHFNIFGSTDVAFSTAMMAAALFLFCLQTDLKIKNGLLLRKLSIIMYCCQGNVLLVNGLFKKTLKAPSLLAFLISLLVTAGICVVVLYIQKRTQWKWSKYLT